MFRFRRYLDDTVMDFNISELGCVVAAKAAHEKLVFDVNVVRRLFYEAYIPVLKMHMIHLFIDGSKRGQKYKKERIEEQKKEVGRRMREEEG